MVIQSDGLVSEHEYIFGQSKKGGKVAKTIDVKSTEDFPTLEVQAAKKKKIE